MPTSALHEGLVALFRERPELAPTLLRDALGARLPDYDAVTLGTEAVPAFNASPLACDAMLQLTHEGRATGAVLVEVQLRVDARKLLSWPIYVTTLRRALGVPVRLLVITPSRSVARWASRPIELSGHGSRLLVDVLGPDAIPEITRADDAASSLELAVLSALAHARGAHGAAIVTAAHDAILALDAPHGLAYLSLIWSRSRGVVRAALEALMHIDPRKLKDPLSNRIRAEGRAEGEAKGKAEGRAEGEAAGKAQAALTVLEARGIAASDAVAARVRACRDLAELDRWVRRAATVARAEDVFGE